ncbi:DedA family protein [Flavitalea antarctica]
MPYIILNIDAESLIRYGGIALLCLLVFCSVGFFFCFFLPIGAILFAAGILTATENLLPSILTFCLLLSLSSVAGSMAGYVIGRSSGKFFYNRKDSRLFRRSYLISTEEFYQKYGNLAMIGSYFLPVIRSFAPVLSGIIKIKFQRFLMLNIIGSLIFISAFVLMGYLVGSLPFLGPWLKYIIAFFVLAVTVPLVVKIIRTIRKPTGMEGEE